MKETIESISFLNELPDFETAHAVAYDAVLNRHLIEGCQLSDEKLYDRVLSFYLFGKYTSEITNAIDLTRN